MDKIKRFLHIWIWFNKPDKMIWHNGNYDWEAKRVFAGVYILTKCEYND